MKVLLFSILFSGFAVSQVQIKDCETGKLLSNRDFYDLKGRKYTTDVQGNLTFSSNEPLLKLVTTNYDTLVIRPQSVEKRYCLNELPINLEEVTIKKLQFSRFQTFGFLKQRKTLLPFELKQWLGKEARSGAATYIEVGEEPYSLAKLFVGIVYEPEIKELDVRIFDFDPNEEKLGQQLFDGELKAVYNKKLRVYETDVSDYRIQGRSRGFLLVIDNLSTGKSLQLKQGIGKGSCQSFTLFNSIKDGYSKLIPLHHDYPINFEMAAEVKICK